MRPIFFHELKFTNHDRSQRYTNSVKFINKTTNNRVGINGGVRTKRQILPSIVYIYFMKMLWKFTKYKNIL